MCCRDCFSPSARRRLATIALLVIACSLDLLGDALAQTGKTPAGASPIPASRDNKVPPGPLKTTGGQTGPHNR